MLDIVISYVIIILLKIQDDSGNGVHLLSHFSGTPIGMAECINRSLGVKCPGLNWFLLKTVDLWHYAYRSILTYALKVIKSPTFEYGIDLSLFFKKGIFTQLTCRNLGPLSLGYVDLQEKMKNTDLAKERHQNSGEILYLYNVKIEGGRGSEHLVP